MTVHLSILLWLPAVGGLAGALLGRRLAAWAALAGSGSTLAARTASRAACTTAR